MTSADSVDPLALLSAARRGDGNALGDLTQLYRNYLQILARVQIDRHLRRRLSPSDLVQETLVKACRNFQQFQGKSEKELLAWLRTILINALRSAVEHEFKAGKRNLRREVSLHDALADLANSVNQLDQALVCQGPSPSNQAARRELAAVMADQIAALPADYRDVLVLRNLEGIAFDEIAQRMNRSVGAVRVLWLRALRRLQENAPAEDQY
jgi:RNA polymerase sigma-70 factor (ECF subfamily)